jgi:tRNA A-37 threonylcarbamoyl transferase component Bud32
MRILGEGVYRSGYKVRHCDLVIKFPTDAEGVKHSAQEIKRLRRLKQCGTLDRFLPEVFYYDKKSGVIVMRYYPEFVDFEDEADAMGSMIGALIQRLTRVKCSDIHTDNVRQNKDDAIIIDLGL